MENTPIPSDYEIPYFVHQDDMNKLDQSHKRIEKWLIICLIVMFITLVATNAYWIYYESQYQDVVTTVTQETSSEGGGNAILNGENAGAMFYGESEADNHNKN